MTILAAYANPPLHRLATAWRGLTAAFSAKATSGPAKHTEPTQKSAGRVQTAMPLDVLIHRRAMRTRNRKPEAVAAFVARHQSLRRGC